MKLSTLFKLMEGREDVLFAKYEQNIEQQLAHNGEKIETRRAFDELFRAVGPKVADWAIRQYLKGQFRIEDAVRVNNDIMQYQKLSRQLPVEERDVNKFDYRYIVNKLDELNKPEINTDAPDEDGVKVMYKGPYGFLCELLTKEAAKRLGSGTKWCTAAEKDNQFDEYHTEGPLFFFRNTRGDKFQFLFEIGQFMDRRNEPITIEQLNEMIKDNPVIRKLLVANIHRMIERRSPPTPTEWERLTKKDPLAVIIQQVLDKQHMHVARVERLKKEFPFLQVAQVSTYEHLHDDDRFIVNLFNMSKAEQYNVLKDMEHDDGLRKRVIDGLLFKTHGKGTHIDGFKVAMADQFYENILTIQSSAFLRDVMNGNHVIGDNADVRTLVNNVLYQGMVGEGDRVVRFTPSQIEYGLRLVQALLGSEKIKAIAQTVAVRGNANSGTMTDKAKNLLLSQCDTTIKPALTMRLSGSPLDMFTFKRLLAEAENGKLPPQEILSAHHVLQIIDLDVQRFTERYITELQSAIEQQKEMLYPMLIVETIVAIHDIALNGKGEMPPHALWLSESKAAPHYKLVENKLSDVANDGLYSFVDLVEHKEKTADEIVDQLTSLYRQHGLAWYIKTDVWKRFVTDLTNKGDGE